MKFQEMFNRVQEKRLFTRVRPIIVRNKSWDTDIYYEVQDDMTIKIYDAYELMGTQLGFSDEDEQYDGGWEFVG